MLSGLLPEQDSVRVQLLQTQQDPRGVEPGFGLGHAFLLPKRLQQFAARTLLQPQHLVSFVRELEYLLY